MLRNIFFINRRLITCDFYFILNIEVVFMKKIVKVDPYYEPRMWGGSKRLVEEFYYQTDIAPLGEVYNVVALPNHADCFVPEIDMTLSKLYEEKPD